MILPYTTSSPPLISSATLHSAPASPLPQPNSQMQPHQTVDLHQPMHTAVHTLPMPLSHPRALSRPLLLLPPHANGHVQPPVHPDARLESPSTLSTNIWHVGAAAPQTTAPLPIIIGTIVGPLPTNTITNTPVPVPVPVQSPSVVSSPPGNTIPSSTTNSLGGIMTSSPTSNAAESTTSAPLPIPPTLGEPSDANGNTANASASDGGSILRMLELILIPAIAVATVILLLILAWRFWGPGGRYRRRRGGQGNAGASGGGGRWWWRGGKRQKRRGGRKGSKDLDGAVLAFVGGSGRLRRDGSLIYGPAYEAGAGSMLGDDERKRGAYGAGGSNAYGMYGQRYPSLEQPSRPGDDEGDEDEGKELGYLGSTPTKASTQPQGRFKWPELSITSLRRSVRRPGDDHQYPPHDFRRHVVDLSAYPQQEGAAGHASHYQNPYDPPREDPRGGTGQGTSWGGGGAPREGFRHWGVSLQETYYDEAVVFPYTDYPENEREWMKDNGTLPFRRKEVRDSKPQSTGAGIVSRNHSETSVSVYPPSRDMSKRSAGTVKGLGLEDGGKGRRLLEEVKKEKTWMDSIRGILSGGAAEEAGAVGAGDREALFGRGDEEYTHEEEVTPRALNRPAIMKTRTSGGEPETGAFVNGYESGTSPGNHEQDVCDDEYYKSPLSTSPRYTSATSKAGSHQQRLTAPSKRRAHKRGDSDAYVGDKEAVEMEGQTTPTQALIRSGNVDGTAMASFGTAMHGLGGNVNLPETPGRRPRLSNAKHSYAPLRDKEEEEAKRDKYTPKPSRTPKSRSRDTSLSPSRYSRSSSGTIRRVESSGDPHGQGTAPQKSPTAMALDALPRSPPHVTSPPLESQMFFVSPPKQAGQDSHPLAKEHSKSTKVRPKNSSSASGTTVSSSSPSSASKRPGLSSRSGTPVRKTPTTSRRGTSNPKPIPPPLIPPTGSASTAHNRSDITFTSRLTGESTGTAARVQVAQNQALDKLGRIVERSWNVREQEIGKEGVRALSPTAFGRKVQG